MAAATAAATSSSAADEAAPRRRSAAPGALAALCLVYVLIAVLPAAPRSPVIGAAGGGSPGWLLGPLQEFGLDGGVDGPMLYAELWIALLLYVAVVWRAGRLSRRTLAAAIAALHVLFLLAPPLLSQDVFSYIAYARLGAEHGLDPYTHSPLAIPSDPVFAFAGSKDAVSAYGPLFTLPSYALAPLGVAGAYWVLKVVAAAASLGVVALVWRSAERLGRDPRGPAALVGLSPLVLVHVVSAAHNEALVMLLAMAGVYAFVRGRPAAAGAWSTAAAGIKASAALVVPYLILGSRPRVRPALLGVLGAALGLLAIGLIGFGVDVFDAFSLLSSNQGRSSRLSLPYKTAELLSADRDAVRAVYAAGFAVVAGWTLWRTWRGADAIRMAGWATFAVLLASAWLVPWYLLWLLPLAALAVDRRLTIATLVLSGWVLAIGIPEIY